MRLASSVILVVLVTAGLGTLWVVNCSGADPEIEDLRLQEPESEGDPYVVLATVHNRMRTPGDVRLTVHLVSEDGETYAKDETVSLGGNESVTVPVEFDVPEGNYEAEADVSYPP